MKKTTLFLVGGIILLLCIATTVFLWTKSRSPQAGTDGLFLEKIISIYSPNASSREECIIDQIKYVKKNNVAEMPTDPKCSTFLDGINVSDPDLGITPTVFGIQNVLVFDLIMTNSAPLKHYLLDRLLEHGYEHGDEYLSLYERYVLSEHLNQKNNKGEDMSYVFSYVIEQDHILDGPFIVESLSVEPSTDLFLINDLYSSGAYNIFGTLYQVTWRENDIEITLAPILTTSNGIISVLPQGNSEEGDFDGGIVNGYFNKEYETFHITGFKPFGLYPCNPDSAYQWHDDSLIEIKISEPKGCQGLTIDDPEDLPEEFDSTLVTTYEITPQLLEKAKAFITTP